MTRYALLLRGVNVGTNNSLPMVELRAMLQRLGCQHVGTYVQSGNAVFTTAHSTAYLTAKIEAALETYMGRPIPTTLRTLAQMKSVVRKNPFLAVATNPARLCVTFLSRPPAEGAVASLRAREWEPERVEIQGKHIYTWHPNGQGRSPLFAALGKLPLKGALTTRNWNTVVKISEMLAGP